MKTKRFSLVIRDPASAWQINLARACHVGRPVLFARFQADLIGSR
jgi:hypothetical protein